MSRPMANRDPRRRSRHAWWSPVAGIASTLERLYAVHRQVTTGRWFLPVMAATGVLAGGFLIALRASNATAYLSERPEACVNCHVMVPYYASWERSSHHQVASCADCHVPHDNRLKKLWFKAMDGLRHATAFTLGDVPQTLRLNPKAVPVVQRNCVRCHEHQVMHTKMGSSANERRCWDCHRTVPHGLAQSLSSTPHVRRPILPSAGIPRAEERPSGVPRSGRPSR